MTDKRLEKRLEAERPERHSFTGRAGAVIRGGAAGTGQVISNSKDEVHCTQMAEMSKKIIGIWDFVIFFFFLVSIFLRKIYIF